MSKKVAVMLDRDRVEKASRNVWPDDDSGPWCDRTHDGRPGWLSSACREALAKLEPAVGSWDWLKRELAAHPEKEGRPKEMPAFRLRLSNGRVQVSDSRYDTSWSNVIEGCYQDGTDYYLVDAPPTPAEPPATLWGYKVLPIGDVDPRIREARVSLPGIGAVCIDQVGRYRDHFAGALYAAPEGGRWNRENDRPLPCEWIVRQCLEALHAVQHDGIWGLATIYEPGAKPALPTHILWRP